MANGGETISDPITDPDLPPPPVVAMRRRILDACARRDIEALRIPIDSNEVRPMFERGARRPPGEDPIERLKALSFDGRGLEIIMLLHAVLRQSFVVVTSGPTRMFVWPAFALKPPLTPTSDERLSMLACVRFADLGRPNPGGSMPPPMRVGIGADGVWHYFWSGLAPADSH